MNSRLVYPFGQVSEHVFASPWSRADLTDEQAAEIEERARRAGTNVVLVKRSRDSKHMARAGEGQAIGWTPYGAAMAALEGLNECE